MKKIEETLRFIKKETGWRQAEFAEKLGVTQASVSRWFSGSDPRGKVHDSINELYVQLTKGTDGTENSHVPLMGYVGAQAEITPEFNQVSPDGIERIEIPFTLPDEMIAFCVRGDSMLPVYREGCIIIVYRNQNKPLEAFYGEEAVVRTSDGRRFIKTIIRGAEGVSLISWNSNPIENVKLDWIGEIFAVLPSRSVLKKPD